MSRRRPAENQQQRPVPPGTFDGNSNADWVKERLTHEKQLRFYKTIVFWFTLGICILLYGVFFLGLFMLHYSPTAQNNFISHNHLLGILLAVLIIPSAILWGIVRAVFRISSSTTSSETIQTVSSLHPFS